MASAQSRKWLITINNPLEHGFDHDRIKAALYDIPSVVYWCMCDEQGDECETLHTHVFFVCSGPVRHTSVDARFPSFHRDIARGKSSENRAYVLKDGEKFNKQEDGSYSYKDTGGHLHEGINFSDTFEEGGELPDERQGKSRDADKIVELIKSGATNEEIVDAVASSYCDVSVGSRCALDGDNRLFQLPAKPIVVKCAENLLEVSCCSACLDGLFHVFSPFLLLRSRPSPRRRRV